MEKEIEKFKRFEGFMSVLCDKTTVIIMTLMIYLVLIPTVCILFLNCNIMEMMILTVFIMGTNVFSFMFLDVHYLDFVSVLTSSALVTFFSGLFNMLVTDILIPDFSFGFIIVNSVFVFLFVWLVWLAETLDLFNAKNLEIVKRKRRKAIQTGYQKECGQKYLSSETIKVLESHRKTLTNESILYPMFALLVDEEDLVNFSHLSESYKHLEKKGSNYTKSKRSLNKLYASLVNEIWERREEEPSIAEYENNLYNKTNEETIKMAKELIVKKRKRKNYE